MSVEMSLLAITTYVNFGPTCRDPLGPKHSLEEQKRAVGGTEMRASVHAICTLSRGVLRTRYPASSISSQLTFKSILLFLKSTRGPLAMLNWKLFTGNVVSSQKWHTKSSSGPVILNPGISIKELQVGTRGICTYIHLHDHFLQHCSITLMCLWGDGRSSKTWSTPTMECYTPSNKMESWQTQRGQTLRTLR